MPILGYAEQVTGDLRKNEMAVDFEATA